MCDCIEKVEKKLREDTGDPHARILAVFGFGENGIEMSIPIPVRYRKKKKDGSFGKELNRNILGGYCPICGKKIQWKLTPKKEAGKCVSH
jgi:hypothetical protein